MRWWMCVHYHIYSFWWCIKLRFIFAHNFFFEIKHPPKIVQIFGNNHTLLLTDANCMNWTHSIFFEMALFSVFCLLLLIRIRQKVIKCVNVWKYSKNRICTSFANSPTIILFAVPNILCIQFSTFIVSYKFEWHLHFEIIEDFFFWSWFIFKSQLNELHHYKVVKRKSSFFLSIRMNKTEAFQCIQLPLLTWKKKSKRREFGPE